MNNKVLYLHVAKNPANNRRFLEGMLRFAARTLAEILAAKNAKKRKETPATNISAPFVFFAAEKPAPPLFGIREGDGSVHPDARFRVGVDPVSVAPGETWRPAAPFWAQIMRK